jgi:hypothetical protein
MEEKNKEKAEFEVGELGGGLGELASQGRAQRGIVRRLKIGYVSKRIRSAGSYRLLLVTANWRRSCLRRMFARVITV